MNTRAIATAVSAVGLASVSCAQPMTGPLPPEPPRPAEEHFVGRYVSEIIDDKLNIHDTVLDEELLGRGRRTPVNRTSCSYEMDFVPVEGGFDLHVTYTNDSTTPKSLGFVTFGGFHFPQEVRHWDFRYDHEPSSFDADGRVPFLPPGFTYPHNLYSPVAVFGDDTHTVGVSVLYPVLEYEHNVKLQLLIPNGGDTVPGGPWHFDIKLEDELDPGESRSYTFTLRVTSIEENWLATLVPYRDYFKALYDGVAYTANPNPIKGVGTTQASNLNDNNPFGWGLPAEFRPDLVGYGPFAEREKDRAYSDGYSRMVIWSITGLYRQNTLGNFPPQFMSQMDNVPEMAASKAALANLPEPDLAVGYWWGHSQQIADYWDDPELELMDPSNPAHRAWCLNELDRAADLGATLVGLDAFVKLPYWEAYDWLVFMQERHPQITFCTERAAPDIMHMRCPTWVNAFQADHPMYLADFILPGHETWGAVQFGAIENQLGRELEPDEMRAEVARVASLGYTPLVFRLVNLNPNPTSFNAADTSSWTIPPFLRGVSDDSDPGIDIDGSQAELPQPDGGNVGDGPMTSSRPAPPPNGTMGDPAGRPGEVPSLSSSRGPTAPPSMVGSVQGVRAPAPNQGSMVKGVQASAPGAPGVPSDQAMTSSGMAPEQGASGKRTNQVLRAGKVETPQAGAPKGHAQRTAGIVTVRSPSMRPTNRDGSARRTFTPEEIRAALERARRDRSGSK